MSSGSGRVSGQWLNECPKRSSPFSVRLKDVGGPGVGSDDRPQGVPPGNPYCERVGDSHLLVGARYD